jgi:hypothetical protein
MKINLSRHLPWLACIVVVGLFITRYLWTTRAGIETHDGIFHLIRQEVFVSELKSGQFPVRWAGALDNGFGLPLFNYIYPGPYYLGAPLSLLGLNAQWVIKIVEVGLYLLGGVGMYLLFAHKHKLYAAISALLYLTTPYLLLNLFVRGALGEFMAISCIPWVLTTFFDMVRQKRLTWYHPLPYALLFISHNFLRFLFLPIYFLLILRYRSAWKVVFLGLLLSLGLAAFFVLPMLLEQGLLYSVASGNYTYNYADHFVYPIQLIFGKWGNGPSLSGLGDGLSFALGVTSLVVLGLGSVTAVKKRNMDLIFWLAISGITLFFLLPASLPIWQLVRPLQLIQFPWRLLSITTITIPLIAFYLLSGYKRTRLISLGLLVGIALSIFFAYQYSTPPYLESNEQLAQQLYVHREKTTTSSRAEILPRWGSLEERWIGEEPIRIATGNAQIIEVVASPSRLTFIADSSDPNTTYQVKRNYFPAWVVEDETSKTYKVVPSQEGDVTFIGQIGRHTYTVQIRSTHIEIIANGVTLFALAICLLLMFRSRA